MKRISNRFKSKTPRLFKRLGNLLLVISTSIAGYSVLINYHKIAIAAAIAGVLGKLLTELAVEDSDDSKDSLGI